MDELHDLCNDLQVDKDKFTPTKDAFIRELLGHLKRRKEINKLIDKGRELRSKSNWPEIPESSADRVQALKQGIATYAMDIVEIFAEIISVLKKLESQGIGESDEELLQNLEQFTKGSIDSKKLISIWSEKQSVQQANIPVCNYSDLAERLKLGEITLFLGNQQPEDLVSKLAKTANYNDFQGTFPEICEYLENDSRQTLLRKIRGFQDNNAAQDESNRETLYQLLSKIEVPLLLISAAYDSTLEQSFANRKSALS